MARATRSTRDPKPADAAPSDVPEVLMIGSEAQPFAKTGGLADVLGALPSALARAGWKATVAVPKYRGVEAGTLVEQFPVTVGGYTRDVGFYDAPIGEEVRLKPDPTGRTGTARALLIDCPDLFDREQLYGVDNVDYS